MYKFLFFERNNVMNLKRGVVFSLALSMCPSVFAQDMQTILTGGVKLACEALLCLSSNVRPAECAPSIAHYFGIVKPSWALTVKARFDFLNLCPVSQQTPEMSNLVSALSNGAGKCTADELNKELAKTITMSKYINCGRFGFNSSCFGHSQCYVSTKSCQGLGFTPNQMTGKMENCSSIDVTIIDNQKPSYCSSLENHQYTDFQQVRYVGEPYMSGYWVNNGDYEAELKRYEQNKKSVFGDCILQ